MTGPIEWTTRDEKRGGALASKVDSKFGRTVGYRRLTIWIHGFNNSEYRAADVWEITHKRVRGLRGSDLLDGTVWFFWPGDTTKHRGSSALFYFMEVRDAVDAGALLATHLREIMPWNPGLKVDFVAHSLGSRLALEAAKLVKQLEGPKVRTMLLFAAAVPEGLCVPGGRYAAPLAESEKAMYSGNDAVLGRLFEPGQWLARSSRGELNPGPQKAAVGYTGGPEERWLPKAIECAYDHGDYWVSDTSLSLLGELYGMAATAHVLVRRCPHERRLPLRYLPRRH